MKVLETNKSLTGNTIKTVKQGISSERIPLAISIIRDRIYTDKLRAALFETLSNAIDEHRKYNITKPVEVRLSNTELVIRDFAKGLSDEDIFQVFFQYFESTKSKDNQYIGGFGIGAKSPAAYTQSAYYVESYYNGRKAVFASVVNGNDSEASLIHSTNCDINDTGIAVRIPLNSPSDYEKFHSLIHDAYLIFGFYDDNPVFRYYYNPKESSSISSDWILYRCFNRLADARKEKRDNLELFDQNGYCYIKDVVLMFKRYDYRSELRFKSDFYSDIYTFAYDGDNLYKINIPAKLFEKYNIRYSFSHWLFLFKRGELPISPSRESIEMNDITLSWLEERFSTFKNKIDNKFKSIREGLETNACYTARQLLIYLNNDYTDIFRKNLITCPSIKLDTFSSKIKTIDFNKNRIGSFTNNKEINSLYHKGNIIFIICDEQFNLPYYAFIDAFNKAIEANPKKYKDTLKSTQYNYFVFITEEDKKETFVSFQQKFALDSKPILRKNFDWFNFSDIKKYSTYVRPKNTKSNKLKTASQEISVLKSYSSNIDIPVNEYPQTLLVYPSYIRSNKNSFLSKFLKDLDYHLNVRGRSVIDQYITEFGLKDIAYCQKSEYDKFLKQGCIDCRTFSPLAQYKKYMKDNKIVILSASMKAYITGFNIDFKKVTGYTLYEYKEGITSRATGYSKLLSCYQPYGLNKLKDREKQLEKEFTDILQEELNETLMTNLIYFFNQNLYMPITLCKKTNNHVANFRKKYDDELKAKIIFALKKLNYNLY